MGALAAGAKPATTGAGGANNGAGGEFFAFAVGETLTDLFRSAGDFLVLLLEATMNGRQVKPPAQGRKQILALTRPGRNRPRRKKQNHQFSESVETVNNFIFSVRNCSAGWIIFPVLLSSLRK